MNSYASAVSDKGWRYLANFWTMVAYAGVIFDFFEDGALRNYLSVILIIYIAILTIYSGVKEFERWYECHDSRHPGELFVIGWTVLLFGLLIYSYVTSKSYQIPGEVLSAYITVVGILAITRKSRSLHARKTR